MSNGPGGRPAGAGGGHPNDPSILHSNHSLFNPDTNKGRQNGYVKSPADKGKGEEQREKNAKSSPGNRSDDSLTISNVPQLIQAKPPPVGADENKLEHSYTFWFSQRGRGAKNKTSAGDFEQNIKYICTVSSVEQFWQAYSRIIQPNDLTGRCDIHLFKFGIRPMWEDDANKNGGKWQVRLKKGVATRCWENLILAMVGEQFACGDEICGAVVSVRYHTEDIVGVWNRTSSNYSIITQIRDVLKRVLNLPTSSIMEYKEHHESIKDASSRQSFPHPGPHVPHHSERHNPNPRAERAPNNRSRITDKNE